VLVAIAICVALYAIVCIGLYAGQRKILFRCDAAEVDPATLGLKAQTLRLKTEDGESLVAWSFPPAPQRPLILYFHGNAGGLDLRAERFRAIAKAGMGLLAIEYRGYASSTGSPSERGLKLDGEAAYAAAIASGVAPERIVPLGESLGSGIAIALAARRKIGALVLDSPYSSIADVAAATYWFVPVRAPAECQPENRPEDRCAGRSARRHRSKPGPPLQTPRHGWGWCSARRETPPRQRHRDPRHAAGLAKRRPPL